MNKTSQDLLEGRLRSKNIEESTTIVSKTNLGLRKFERSLKFIKGINLGDNIMRGERLLVKTQESDAIPVYKGQFLPSSLQLVEAARKHQKATETAL